MTLGRREGGEPFGKGAAPLFFARTRPIFILLKTDWDAHAKVNFAGMKPGEEEIFALTREANKFDEVSPPPALTNLPFIGGV